MSGVEKPIYLIAVRDLWYSTKHAPNGCAIAFGDEGHARRYIRRLARRDGLPESLYRIIKYEFSGDVKEG
jgi:hypothetical protein